MRIRLFRGSRWNFVHDRNGIDREWCQFVRGGRLRGRCVPSMRTEDTLDIGFGGESGVRSGLLNSDTIIVIQESKVLEWGFIFLRKLEGRANDREDVFRQPSVFYSLGDDFDFSVRVNALKF